MEPLFWISLSLLYQAVGEDSYDSANYRHVKSRVDTLKQRSIDRNSLF